MTIQRQEAPRAGTKGTVQQGTVQRPAHELRPARDVRRKRPPMLSFVLRLETLRRIARVASLLLLDLIGVAGALFTSLLLKLVWLGHCDAGGPRTSRRARTSTR